VRRAAFRGILFDDYFTHQPETYRGQRFPDDDALKSRTQRLVMQTGELLCQAIFLKLPLFVGNLSR
jgi:hypothetical protein